jgi:ribosomal protein S18 acetylase RimI-like enzyme
MKSFEELFMNALPCLQTELYDGWILRFSDGYTYRSNSVNPIYPSYENVNDKIDRCEMIYKSRNLNPAFKVTPFVFPTDLDSLLIERGYKDIYHTSVQTIALHNLIEPSIQTITVYDSLHDDWFDNYCYLNHISADNQATLRKMLDNMVPFKLFVLLKMNSKVIACGMAVLENEYFGLFNITVYKENRNCGYGTQLLYNMFKLGKSYGAKYTYLSVMLNNLPAIELYKKLGFKETYRYHYRVLTT